MKVPFRNNKHIKKSYSQYPFHKHKTCSYKLIRYKIEKHIFPMTILFDIVYTPNSDTI